MAEAEASAPLDALKAEEPSVAPAEAHLEQMLCQETELEPKEDSKIQEFPPTAIAQAHESDAAHHLLPGTPVSSANDRLDTPIMSRSQCFDDGSCHVLCITSMTTTPDQTLRGAES